jgi:hypothetical protein
MMKAKGMKKQIPLMWKIGIIALCLVLVITTLTTAWLVIVLIANGSVMWALKFMLEFLKNAIHTLLGFILRAG